MKHNIYLVGMGPGKEEMMTGEALKALEAADVIIGYTVYIKLLGERFADKEMRTTPMRQEEERCKLCFEEAKKGKQVAMVCSGDAGIYGMASLLYEMGKEYPDTEIFVIPGITAACSGAAVLGAPLMHDFAVISLSDLLTPWEQIEERLEAAAKAGFVICLYNPSSKKRADYLQKACDIFLKYRRPDTICGFVKNIGREGETYQILPLEILRETAVDMFTTVYIGTEKTMELNGKMVTPRGYREMKKEKA